jgi:hypothetical protein
MAIWSLPHFRVGARITRDAPSDIGGWRVDLFFLGSKIGHVARHSTRASARAHAKCIRLVLRGWPSAQSAKAARKAPRSKR